MAISLDTIHEIEVLVRGGFEKRGRIIEILTEELHELGELNKKEIKIALDKVIDKHNKDKKKWSAVTDCDKLNEAFTYFSNNGIIALQNAGFTQSDGYEEVVDAYQAHPKRKNIIGFCFYHSQDLEMAIRGDGLLLSFGPIDPKNEKSEGKRIGLIISNELKLLDFRVKWNGKFDQRIYLPKIDWKRR